MSKVSKIIARLKRLLAVTLENGASENEAAIAATAARRLLDEYELTIAEVEAATNDPSAIKHEFCTSGFRVSPSWFRLLYTAIATAFDCEVLAFRASERRMAGEYELVGFEQDVAVASFLIKVLRRELERAASQAARLRCASLSYRRKFRTDFLNAAIITIYQRLKLQREASRSSRKDQLIVAKRELIGREIGEVEVGSIPLNKPSTRGADHGKQFGSNVCLDGRPLPSPKFEHQCLIERKL